MMKVMCVKVRRFLQPLPILGLLLVFSKPGQNEMTKKSKGQRCAAINCTHKTGLTILGLQRFEMGFDKNKSSYNI